MLVRDESDPADINAVYGPCFIQSCYLTQSGWESSVMPKDAFSASRG